MDNDKIIRNAKLVAARETKQLSGFHGNLMGDVKSSVNVAAAAYGKAADAGHFEGVDVGTRFQGKQGPPFKVDAHFMREWKGDRSGYWGRTGVQPSLTEHEGKQYVPVLRVSSGVEGKDPEWSVTDAYPDVMRHLGYKPMGITKAEGGGITAYHGSPHDFDKFDVSKIGTGEGAASFGKGLYFTDTEDVAKKYRDQIALNKNQFDIVDRHTGEKIDEGTPGYKPVQRFMNSYAYDLRGDDITHAKGMWGHDMPVFEKQLKEYRDYANSHPDRELAKWAHGEADKIEQDIAHLKAAPALLDRATAKPIGKMYKAKLDVNPEHLLDWDKPLAGQHAWQKLRAHWDDELGDPDIIAQRLGLDGVKHTGGDLMQHQSFQGKAAVSDMLLKAGVPGIKYKDGMSRGSTGGTHNYVMFHHDPVQIEGKYSKGGFIAGNHPDVPEKVFHGTRKDFSQFYPMSHFGTELAANMRLDGMMRFHHPAIANKAHIMPVHLSMKNPLDVGREDDNPDRDSWSDNADMFKHVAHKLPDDVHRQNLLELAHEMKRVEEEPEHLRRAADIISSAGYDGIKYKNAIEHAGSTSYVALYPEQIKSATGNRGTFDPNDPDITKAEGGSVLSTDDYLKGEDGQPLHLYHGTNTSFNAFDPAKTGQRDAGYWGKGHYLTPDKEMADSYSLDEGKNAFGITMGPMHAALKNPFVWDASSKESLEKTKRKLKILGIDRGGSLMNAWDNLKSHEVDKFTKMAIYHGHDGVVYRSADHDSDTLGGPGRVAEIVVFKPEAIKHADVKEPDFSQPNIYRAYGGRANETNDIWWHGTGSGDLRGGPSGLHLGTKEAATEALCARIGYPADGSMWDGNKACGETRLAGRKTMEKWKRYQTGVNADGPDHDFLPHERKRGLPSVSRGTPMQPHWRPSLDAYQITGGMTNSPGRPHGDNRANAMMQAGLTKGNAKSGFYYKNDGEDEGSISAVVPGPSHIQKVEGHATGGRTVNKLGLYSKAAEIAQGLPQAKGSVDQMLAMLKKGGVKMAELDHAGRPDGDMITRDALAAHFNSKLPNASAEQYGNQPDVMSQRESQERIHLFNRHSASINGSRQAQPLSPEEHERLKELTKRMTRHDPVNVIETGDDGGPADTQYEDYKTPGGDKYRERLLVLPRSKRGPNTYDVDGSMSKQGFTTREEAQEYADKRNAQRQKLADEEGIGFHEHRVYAIPGKPEREDYQSSHWHDHRNVLAHIRMQDRVTGPEANFGAAKEWVEPVVKKISDHMGVEASALGSGAAEYAVANGLISPQEAATLARIKGWTSSGHHDKPGLSKRVLHVEELQSDWAQQGRERGFKPTDEDHVDTAGWTAKEGAGDFASGPVWEVRNGEGRWVVGTPRENHATAEDAIRHAALNGPRDRTKYSSMLPTAPYVQNTQHWTDLALKNVLAEAAHGSYDHVMFTGGQEQADRYGLEKHFKSISYDPEKKHLYAASHTYGGDVNLQNTGAEEIAQYIGTGLTDRLLHPSTLKPQWPGQNMVHHLDGDDLKTGGEGMKGYYDNILPKSAMKLVQQHDPSIQSTTIDGKFGFDMTDKARESILKGQQAFWQGGEVKRLIKGFPEKVPGFGTVAPSEHVRRVAQSYMSQSGLPYNPPQTYAKVDPKRAARIAEAFGKMKDDPTDPLTKVSYEQMAKETMAQYHHAKQNGFKAEFWDPATQEDPYGKTPRQATEDVQKNNHMWVYPTHAGYGSGISETDVQNNPLLADSGERWNGKPVTVNDVFRAVHDYYGHSKEGVGFRHDGEENAWRAHASMFSPLARMAMTTETRGQNSWLNFGPHGEKNRNARTEDTVFADQKIGILPHWVHHEGAEDFMSPSEIRSMAAHRAYHNAIKRVKP